MILGAMLVVWGAIVLYFAEPLHTHWKQMNRSLRRDGYGTPFFGTEWLASGSGLRWMRRAGGGALAVGAALLVAGAVRAVV
jgi:hypothetical protein